VWRHDQKKKWYACTQYKPINKQSNVYATHPQKVRMCAHTQDPRGVGLCLWWEKKEGGDAWVVAKKCVAVNFFAPQIKVLGQLAEERKSITKCLRPGGFSGTG